MAQIQTLRRRIKATAGIQQTTKAMQLVDATKLRKSQQLTAESKAYIEVANSVLQRLVKADVSPGEVPLMRKRPVKTVTLVGLASDRGLAGAYNHSIGRRMRQQAAQYHADGVKVQIIAVGAQLIRTAEQLENVTIIGRYPSEATRPVVSDVRKVAEQLTTQYVEATTDKIEVVYTKSYSALRQEVTVMALWPYEAPEGEEIAKPSTKSQPVEALEPSAEEVLDAALARLLTAQLLHAFQEARVSEHAMRMIAMRNATDNAGDLIDKLTLEVNTARQAAITQELSEITGAVAAMEE